METTNATGTIAVAAFHSRTMVMPFWMGIMLITWVTTGAIFVGILAGLPVVLNMALFMGLMVFTISLLSGEADYEVHPHGVVQKLQSLRWAPIKLWNLQRNFTWNDVKWYQRGEEMSRSLTRYQFLKIKLHKWPYKLTLTDLNSDQKLLAEFCEVFERYALGNTNVITRSGSGVEGRNIENQFPAIKRKPDFYKTAFAKIVFFLLLFFFLIIAVAMVLTNNYRTTNLLRIAIVIVPGLWYFWHRIQKKKDANNNQ